MILFLVEGGGGLQYQTMPLVIQAVVWQSKENTYHEGNTLPHPRQSRAERTNSYPILKSTKYCFIIVVYSAGWPGFLFNYLLARPVV
jgi:hypothetical protein